MKRLATESMTCFYLKLKAQGHRCGQGSWYIQERVLRDRLIQSITDIHVLAEVLRVPEPSIQDVLHKESVSTWMLPIAPSDLIKDVLLSPQFQQALPFIIPYLGLDDLAALVDTSQFTHNLVYRNLDSGVPLTITGQFLERFPVDKNEALYGMLYFTKHLILVRVQATDAAKIVSIIAFFERLTMCHMLILDHDLVRRIDTLKELHLIHVKIKKSVFETWMGQDYMKWSLNSLSLIWTDTAYLEGKPYCIHMKKKTWGPKLCSFTFKGDHLELSIGFDYSLSVAARTLTCERYNLYTQDLALVVGNQNSFLNLDRWFCSLTLGSYYGSELPRTRTLKIVQRVDPKFKTKAGRRKGIYFYEYATAQQQDLILQRLNDDCLIEVLQHLSTKDCVAFSQTHSRIRKLVLKYKWKSFDSENEEHQILLQHPKLCKLVAPFIRKVKVTKKNHLWIIPYCTSLASVELLFLSLSERVIKHLPTQVESLIIPQLQSSGALEVYLSKLKNLQEFAVNPLNQSTASITALLQRNKDTLRHIIVEMRSSERSQWMWSLIGSLPNVNQLTLQEDYLHQTPDAVAKQRPHLKTILDKIARNLVKLEMTVHQGTFDRLITATRFPQLEELTLWVVSPANSCLADSEIQCLCSLTQLKRLRIKNPGNGRVKITHDQCVSLKSAFPGMIVLEVGLLGNVLA